MALFSRRKKSVDAAPADEPVEAAEEATTPEPAPESEAPSEPAPAVNISVQAFRGVGATAGPAVPAPGEEPAVTKKPAAGPTGPVSGMPEQAPSRDLPLAPVAPPAQTETIAGMKDNVLLREALARVEQGATNEQLLGVLRQALQGHLYLRVTGDAREQISEGKPLSIAVIRNEDKSYMLAFSSAAAVRASVQRESDPMTGSAVAQPVTSVFQQAVQGGFAGIILDNASGVHRAVFPTELLQKTLEQGDPEMRIKTLLAAPRQADSAVRVGEALAAVKTWVAVGQGGEGRQPGIAEAQTPDGKRYLQLFSHPLEVVALGRGDRPLPFEPERLAKVLADHPEMSGVLIDPAGPSIVVERDALTPVLVLAADTGE